ncbi:MAG: DUF3027 domain-containing protein [Corynebacterium sp.]|nr:DUF3027 domain-containing protein [Corynebacterium sp.]
MHQFVAHVPGYTGWEWNVVLACAASSRWITVSELVLLPGRAALQAPEWVPYQNRIQPGDLGPGDHMPTPINDTRLTTTKENAAAINLPLPTTSKSNRMLSTDGLNQALHRWQTGEYGPQSPHARQSKLKCASCAFYLPLPAAGVGVCANEYSADGSVVATKYGCGAHSQTPQPQPKGKPTRKPFYDDKPIPVDI